MNLKPTIVTSFFSVLGAAALINLTYILYRYCVLGTYLDHAEPDTVIMAWRLASGLPLYYPIEAAEHFFTAYGPVLFILTALPLKLLGPSIIVSKIASTSALGISAIIFGYYTWRRYGFTYVGLGIMTFTFYPLIVSPVSFWVRPEAHTVLLMALALLSTLAANGDRRWITAIIVAACAGLAMNLKIHSFIYFVPLVFRYCSHNWLKTWPIMAFVIVLVFLLPFSLQNISLVNYIEGVVGFILGRPPSVAGVLKALKWSPIFLAPGIILILTWFIGAKRACRADLIYFAVYTICLVTAFYPSSVPGSTWRQMLPFFPLTIDLFLRFLRLLEGSKKTWVVSSFMISMIIGVIAITPTKRILKRYDKNHWGAAAADEISSLIARYPNQKIQMGYGDGNQTRYPNSYLRPLFAFAGYPITISVPSSMERQFAGQSFPQSKLEWIRECKTHLWALPKRSRPFSVKSYYMGNHRVFPKIVEKAFLTNYERHEVIGRYRIWSCRDGVISSS